MGEGRAERERRLITVFVPSKAANAVALANAPAQTEKVYF